MKKTCLTLVAIIFALSLKSQDIPTVSDETNGFLRGRLFDSQTREPLMFSSVALLNDADSSLLIGAITDESGRFLLENLRYGYYRLRISSIGYHTFISNTIELSRGNNRLDLGSFFINPSTTQLTEVEIVATRPVLEQQAGRLVFNVAESTTSVGDNALETLSRFPGVVVENDNSITMNGRNVLVTIDGRETHLSGEQLANLLRSMPAEQIGSIEGIDNPGARFSAEGIAGILNIRTRRTRMIGYSGSIFAGVRYNYNRALSYDQGFDINFRNNRVTAFANFSHSERNFSSGRDDFRNFPDGTRWQINRGKGSEREAWSMDNSYPGLSGRGGIDYHINNRNILSLSYRIVQGKSETIGDFFTRIGMGNAEMTEIARIDSSSRQHFDFSSTWRHHNLSLNYQHIFDSANQRQFFIDASWIRSGLFQSNDINTVFFSGNFADTIRRELHNYDVRLPSDIFSIRADLEFPINRETGIEVGTRYSFVNNDNNQYTNSTLSDRYIYSEHILAAYIQLNHTFSPRLSVTAGLRGEYTALRGNNRMIDSIHTNSYFGLFPSLNINHQLTDRTGLNFSYSRRLRRPNYSLLNPVVISGLRLMYMAGNPYLKPEYSHIFTLAYSFNHLPIVRVFYARSNGQIRHISHFHGDTLWSRPENLGRNDAINLQLMFQHTFFDRWRFLVRTGGEYSRTHFEYNGIPETRESFGVNYSISNDITLSPTMSMDINSWGAFPQRFLFSRRTGRHSVDIGFRKSFFNRALTATINVSDVFNTLGSTATDMRLPTGQQDYVVSYWASRSVSVRLSYRFGRGNVQTRRMREAATEEAGRMGIGM
ncbi:MAG: TonB-dependent receptor [Bacteroidales bacterium]|nr:TonB-dependent receptor [Bacteroidales bacterium]